MRCFALLALVSVVTVGTSSALVDANLRTAITVEDTGCNQGTYYCCPECTLDGTLSTRWSCKEELEDEPCKLTYFFEETQVVEEIRIAFGNGNGDIPRLRIRVNGCTHSFIEISGDIPGYQTFPFHTDGADKISLEAVGLGGDWISISEVKFMVY